MMWPWPGFVGRQLVEVVVVIVVLVGVVGHVTGLEEI